MMEPTDFGNLDDRPRGGGLGWADVGRVVGTVKTSRETKSRTWLPGTFATAERAGDAASA